MIPDASPFRGQVRELLHISLPIGAAVFEAESLPEPTTLEFEIGLMIGGVPVWREHVSLPLGIFSKTAKIGDQIFTADFNNPLKVYAGQEVRVFAAIPMVQGTNQGTLAWSMTGERSGEFFLWQGTGNGTISYVDRSL